MWARQREHLVPAVNNILNHNQTFYYGFSNSHLMLILDSFGWVCPGKGESKCTVKERGRGFPFGLVVSCNEVLLSCGHAQRTVVRSGWSGFMHRASPPQHKVLIHGCHRYMDLTIGHAFDQTNSMISLKNIKDSPWCLVVSLGHRYYHTEEMWGRKDSGFKIRP